MAYNRYSRYASHLAGVRAMTLTGKRGTIIGPARDTRYCAFQLDGYGVHPRVRMIGLRVSR